tara:strand:- start:189 stop:509 length:321 start_codon:yes stop_codon:yes gene_type:complete
MKKEVGTRVFAVLSANEDEVRLIGCGKYLGDLPISDADENVRLFGMSPQEVSEHAPDLCNPCLEMDDGTIVWGCECWWGPEDNMDEMTKGRKIVDVDITKERAKHL